MSTIGVTSNVADKVILLIDDVTTTGEYDGVLLSVKICRRKDNIATGVTRNS